MIEFLKQHRAQCAKDAKAMNFWYSSKCEDVLGA
ncbi:conserved hypothetical protein [Vibrio phage 381E49-1]|nr:conserved hypothetical protein [Vibrio phage 381E49-1]